MNGLATIFDHPLLRSMPWRSLGVPLVIFMVLAMMIIPLPPFLLDLLFTFNIALALIVMMAAAYTRRRRVRSASARRFDNRAPLARFPGACSLQTARTARLARAAAAPRGRGIALPQGPR